MGGSPGVPVGNEVGKNRRLLFCKVVALGAVGGDVVQLPDLTLLVEDGLPVAVTDIAVVEMLAVDIIVYYLLGRSNGRAERNALNDGFSRTEVVFLSDLAGLEGML